MNKKQMRILMLSWEYPPHVIGGLGAHVAALVPALARAGVCVSLVTPRWKGGKSLEILDVSKQITRSKTRTRFKPVLSTSIYRIDPPVAQLGNFVADVQQTNLNLEEFGHSLFKRNDNFELIHAHDWLVAFSAASLKRLHKTPLVATMHATERGRGHGSLSGEMSQAINGTEWWLSYEAWRVIATSQFMRDEIKTYFQVPGDKIDIVPNGVDATPFDKLDGIDLSGFRRHWALPEEYIVFFLGRLVQEKGAHLLLESVPRVIAEIPQTRFIIAGTGSMKEYLERRAWDLGVADKVNVAGFISDPDRDRLLKVANVAVFPSLYEPFGIVALEAMAAKCPVIVSEVGGLKEVVRHNETGIMVHPDNVESLAWGILHTLHRLDWSRSRTANAYRMVKEEYNWDRIAAKTIDIYERIIRERAKTDW